MENLTERSTDSDAEILECEEDIAMSSEAIKMAEIEIAYIQKIIIAPARANIDGNRKRIEEIRVHGDEIKNRKKHFDGVGSLSNKEIGERLSLFNSPGTPLAKEDMRGLLREAAFRLTEIYDEPAEKTIQKSKQYFDDMREKRWAKFYAAQHHRNNDK